MPTRYLKPGICDSEAIDKCSPLAECLFYRLLVNVDDFGRLDARPAVVRSRCFPLKDEMTNNQTATLLMELHNCGLIILYKSNECAFLQLSKWDNVPRSKVSKCPAYTDDCIQLYTDVCKPRTNLPVTVTETGTGTGTGTPPSDPADRVDVLPKETSKTPTRKPKSFKTPIPDDFAITPEVRAWAAEKSITNLDDHFEYFVIYCKAKGYTYADWSSAFKTAVRKDWASIGHGTQRRFVPA